MQKRRAADHDASKALRVQTLRLTEKGIARRLVARDQSPEVSGDSRIGSTLNESGSVDVRHCRFPDRLIRRFKRLQRTFLVGFNVFCDYSIMKRLPTLKQLEYLVELAEAEHFGRAAQRCFVTQSTLSAGIRDLEDVLGTPVAERSNRRVLITPLGRKIAERGKILLRDAGEIMELARASSAFMSGELHLGVIPTIGPYLLPRVLPPLREKYPELTLYLREEQSAPLLRRLRAGELDVALIALPYATDGLVEAVIFDDDFFFACHSDHPFSNAPQLPISALAGEPLMLLEEGHCLRSHALDVFKMGDRRARLQFEATSLHTLIQMVAAGIGVTLLPQLALDADIIRGTNISVVPLRTSAARQVALVWRESSSRAEEFALLAQEIGYCVNPLNKGYVEKPMQNSQ